MAPTPSTPAWAEVSLQALAHNLKQMKSLAAPAGVIAMVKANAYGHGLIPVSKTFLKAGAQGLAVAFPQEGMALRQAGIGGPILVVAPVLEGEIAPLLRAKLTPQISSYEGALAISRAAAKLKLKSVPVQVELDSGMGRVGFRPSEIARDLGRLLKLTHLRVEAFYAHFATADWADPKFAARQIGVFRAVLNQVRLFMSAKEKTIPTHLANSAALLTRAIRGSASFARPGIALYGVFPSPRLKGGAALIPAMQLKARILHLKTIEKGDSVSYGRTYIAKKKVKVATLGIGYADGLHRALSNKGHCLVGGKKVPLIGTVCMDMVMADVSAVPGVKAGDVATLFGKDGKAFLPVEEQAAAAGTISYELLCAVGPRVPRVYGS
ncbi:MAG TPA: alanine racemase [bacterium]|nr:alanine racemase [bacterium]